MINEETFVRQIVKVKPHQNDLEETISTTTVDEEDEAYSLQNYRRQSLPADAYQSYDIFMKVIRKNAGN